MLHLCDVSHISHAVISDRSPRPPKSYYNGITILLVLSILLMVEIFKNNVHFDFSQRTYHRLQNIDLVQDLRAFKMVCCGGDLNPRKP